jgi:hypothetical protein
MLFSSRLAVWGAVNARRSGDPSATVRTAPKGTSTDRSAVCRA